MKAESVKLKVPSFFKLPTLLFVTLLFVFSCSNEEVQINDIEAQEPNIMEVLESFNRNASTSKSNGGKYSDSEPTFEILSVALAKTKLASTVSKNRLTVFAPTDKAFMDAGITKKAVADIPGIADVLLYHVLSSPVYSMALENGTVETVNGAGIVVNVDGDYVLINNSKVIMADIKARNGVIHVLDSVLFPPSMTIAGIASNNPDFSILFDAVAKANLGEALTNGGPFTVFAPTNQAFLDLLEATPYTSLDDIPVDMLIQILLYHVVDGYVFSNQLSNGFVRTLNGAAVQVDLSMGAMINDATVIIPNVQATNGVVHAINKVLLPPTLNLVDLASSFDPEFSLLLHAATTANLADTLATGGPFTVFAPTNAAFLDFLSLTDIEEAKTVISGLEVSVLTNILLYHVVEGRVYSSDLSSGSVTTLNGDFDLDLGTLTIDGNAKLVADLLNVQATNGVIHVIDAVLVP